MSGHSGRRTVPAITSKVPAGPCDEDGLETNSYSIKENTRN